MVRGDAVMFLFDTDSVFGARVTAKASCAGVLCYWVGEVVTLLFDEESALSQGGHASRTSGSAPPKRTHPPHPA